MYRSPEGTQCAALVSITQCHLCLCVMKMKMSGTKLSPLLNIVEDGFSGLDKNYCFFYFY